MNVVRIVATWLVIWTVVGLFVGLAVAKLLGEAGERTTPTPTPPPRDPMLAEFDRLVAFQQAQWRAESLRKHPSSREPGEGWTA